MNRNLLLAIPLAIAALASAAAAETRCVRDEQRGCFSVQIVGVEHDGKLMQTINRSKPIDRAANLGPKVYKGVKSGEYEPHTAQAYVLYLWMKPSWGDRGLPADRMVKLALDRPNQGVATAYKPTWIANPRQWPTVNDPTRPNLGQAHFALTAKGKVGAGWVIPKDVMKHVALMMICPQGGDTHFPFRRNGKREGIVHSGEEIAWYLRQRWDYVLSAAVW